MYQIYCERSKFLQKMAEISNFLFLEHIYQILLHLQASTLIWNSFLWHCDFFGGFNFTVPEMFDILTNTKKAKFCQLKILNSADTYGGIVLFGCWNFNTQTVRILTQIHTILQLYQ